MRAMTNGRTVWEKCEIGHHFFDAGVVFTRRQMGRGKNYFWNPLASPSSLVSGRSTFRGCSTGAPFRPSRASLVSSIGGSSRRPRPRRVSCVSFARRLRDTRLARVGSAASDARPAPPPPSSSAAPRLRARDASAPAARLAPLLPPGVRVGDPPAPPPPRLPSPNDDPEALLPPPRRPLRGTNDDSARSRTTTTTATPRARPAPAPRRRGAPSPARRPRSTSMPPSPRSTRSPSGRARARRTSPRSSSRRRAAAWRRRRTTPEAAAWGGPSAPATPNPGTNTR